MGRVTCELQGIWAPRRETNRSSRFEPAWEAWEGEEGRGGSQCPGRWQSREQLDADRQRGSPGLVTHPLSLSDLDSQPHTLGKRRACPPGLPAPASSLGDSAQPQWPGRPRVRAEGQGSGTRRKQGISRSWSPESPAACARNCFGNKGGVTRFWFQT